MKKFILIGIFLVCLSLNTYNAFNINNCTNEMKINDLNSKNLLNYITENNLKDKILKVCSMDICTSLNASNLETDIKDFINRNLNYLKGKDNDLALEAELKGFKIDKIIINSCT